MEIDYKPLVFTDEQIKKYKKYGIDLTKHPIINDSTKDKS